MKMNKKILMSTIALLALFMMIISPAKAITKGPYVAEIEIDRVDPGTEWEANGIYHNKNSYWDGTVIGTLGSGRFEAWFNHISVNTATGKGTFSGKWRITFPEGTLMGSARGKITGGNILSGTFAGGHGTDDLEGVRKMGSLEGAMTTATHISMEALGTIYNYIS